MLQARPTVSQQDYTLFHVLLAREGPGDDFVLPLPSRLSSKPVFSAQPTVGTTSFRRLLRFLCGLEDFARINAHFRRREAHPLLSRDDCKRACLSCLVRRNRIVLDSEWPLSVAPRNLFSHAFPLIPVQATDSFRSYISLIVSASENSQLLNEFALWVGGILMCRRREFRALLPTSPLSFSIKLTSYYYTCCALQF